MPNTLPDAVLHEEHKGSKKQALAARTVMVPYTHAYLIYNPFAGKIRRKPHLIDQALTLLTRMGHHVTPAPTTGPNTASDIARECIARGADLIVACGGDGTLNEVANGVAGSSVPMMVLPGGTANVLASELEIGGKIKKAIRKMPRMLPRRVPLGKFTSHSGRSRYFLLMAGAGLDAYIVHTLNPWLKERFGKSAYWIGGFSALLRVLPEFTVEAEGATYRASFALASRVRNYGGDLEIARTVRLDDPEFEVVLFEGWLALTYLKYFYGIATDKLRGMSGVHIFRSKRLRFSGDALAHVDGEAMGPIPVELEIVPDALTVLMPPEYGV